jgi:hypothetical protein
MKRTGIQLATDEELRSITSQNVGEILGLPFLHVATDELDVVRACGVHTIADYERLYPGALVAPRFDGQTASRGDLLYNGAGPAAVFIQSH